MRFLSLCSGIEAASVAWHPLGWRAVAFSEIDRFPSAVLSYRYPDVPNLGDMTRFQEWPNLGTVDLVVGGTPCQSYSVAGLRAGLDDPRGDLMLTFGAVARRVGARWLVWENVPGVLSSNGGRDFGTFLGLLAELGYGFAYRVFDAQYAGLAQRRERVFVVGCLGDWRSAAAVLFERSSLSGDPAPSREKGERVALPITSRVDRGGEHRESHGNNLVPVAFQGNASASNSMNPSEISPTLDKGKADGMATFDGAAVRRLTPRECERLQGFTDDYTLIPYRGGMAKDGPRYKALGNSMAVPCMRWIGERIALVEALRLEAAA